MSARLPVLSEVEVSVVEVKVPAVSVEKLADGPLMVALVNTELEKTPAVRTLLMELEKREVSESDWRVTIW